MIVLNTIFKRFGVGPSALCCYFGLTQPFARRLATSWAIQMSGLRPYCEWLFQMSVHHQYHRDTISLKKHIYNKAEGLGKTK